MQIQISSCSSYCEDTTQVQVASQSSTVVQSVGSAVEQAPLLEAQPPASAPQVTTTLTQFQLGCLSNCFGTTTSDPSTAALTQLVLSQLSSLLPPSTSTSVPPVPATEQTVVGQSSCQVQIAGADTAQTQSALQTSATVQLAQAVASLAASLASAANPQAVAQTEQQTWQLQIGCLAYCSDSQQVQQAQQTATTVQVVDGNTVTVVQQSIWQLQIGCLAWCWDSTQLQTASTQSTIVVTASPPSGDGQAPTPPQPPAPTAGTAGPATAGTLGPAAVPPPPGPPGPSGPPPAPASASGPPAVGPPAVGATYTANVRLLRAPRVVGVALLTGGPATNQVAQARVPATPAGPLPRAALMPPATGAGMLAAGGGARRSAVRRRSADLPRSVPRARLIGSVAPALIQTREDNVVALLIAVAGAVALAVLLGRRATDRTGD